MIRRCSPNSLLHTFENCIVVVLILAVALMSVARGTQAQIAFVSARDGDLNIYVMDGGWKQRDATHQSPAS